MKYRIKNSLHLLLMAALSAMLLGCEKDAAFKEYDYPEPVITDIYPATGYAGSHVAVLGTNFGDQVEAIKVLIGEVEVENILSCKNDRITVEVPKAAQSGKVTVQVWKHVIESESEYTVIPTPVITSVSSSNAAGNMFAVVNDVLTIVGSAFGTEAGKVKVEIRSSGADARSYKMEIISVSDTEIVVKVPEYGMAGMLVVNIGGYEVEGSGLINPAASGDVTSLFIKNYTQPFQRGDVSDSEWGTPLYWLTSNGYGSALQITAEQPGGLLAIQSGWGQGKKENAKLYQLTTLPQGTYTFSITVAENTKESGRYGAVFAVSQGEGTIPDLDGELSNAQTYNMKQFTYNPNVEKASLLTWVQVTSATITEPVVRTCQLTLKETTTVTIGFTSMINGANAVKFSDIKIERQ